MSSAIAGVLPLWSDCSGWCELLTPVPWLAVCYEATVLLAAINEWL
ncbi:hypothetical protein [Streptomyces sp. NPDC058308]